MKVRLPTKAQYSYIEFDSLEEFEDLSKEELIKLLEKHYNACKIALAVGQNEHPF